MFKEPAGGRWPCVWLTSSEGLGAEFAESPGGSCRGCSATSKSLHPHTVLPFRWLFVYLILVDFIEKNIMHVQKRIQSIDVEFN